MAISRRDMLKTAAAVAAGPTLLLGSKAVTLGSGEHTYEFDGDWGRLPNGRQYGYTHGVAMDSQERIIIHNRSKDAVAIFDRDGKFVKSWGEDFETGAHGLLLNKEGNTEYLYLADPERHLVAKATLDGERLWVLRCPKESSAYEREEQYKPTNVAVAPNGDVYIADGYGLSWIHQYNSKAEYIRSWGGKGKEAGKLDCPHGIWIDTRGAHPVVTVADRSNGRLQNFTLDGKHIGFVNDELRRPCHFDQRNGELLIPDLWGRVTIFDKNNKLITHLGDNPEVWKTKGWPNLPHEMRETGKFVSPHAACWDREGNIYVVEWIADGRVTKLRRGQKARRVSMRLGIDFGTTRTVVATVDRGNYPVVSFEAPDGSAHEWFPSLIAVRGEQRVYGWEAWARQQEPDWTVVRSLKRLLEDAGPRTRIAIGDQSVPLLELLVEMARAIRAQLPHEAIEVMLGVPANANGNQRFLTAEAFRCANFEVLGMLNEPSAASIEYIHKNKVTGLLLVYDLGGGTFDASLVEMGEREHRVIVSEGISTLGGEDFDHILAEMAAGPEIYPSLSQSEMFRIHEECRLKKEALHPNTRKIVLDLDAVREGLGTVSIPIGDFYDRCRPLLEETENLVEDLIATQNVSTVEALYVTGGGSELPLVGRVLREKFGRRVKRSAYTRSATAIGLAIQADSQAGYVLRDHFTRYFGVWREGDEGRTIVFDPLFGRGTLLPTRGEPALEISRAYCPVHNVGVFRYLECSHLDEGGRPAGDITVWDEIRFPFDPELNDADDTPVLHLDRVRHQTIEEKYACDGGGVVTVTVRNDTAGYSRDYRLGRWAAKEPPMTPGKPKNSTRTKGSAHSRRTK